MDREKLQIQLDRFIAFKSRAWNTNSLRRNRYYFGLLLDFIGNQEFNRNTVEAFFNSLKGKLAESTRNKCEEGVLSFIAWLDREEIISKNWGKWIVKTVVHKKSKPLPSQSEMLELIRNATEVEKGDNRLTRFAKGERRACLSFILVACGGRNFETTQILRKDISISGRQILIERGKTGPRMCGIPEVPWLIDDLERRVKGLRTEDKLKTLSDKTHFKESDLQRLFVVNSERLRETMVKVGKLWGNSLCVHDLRRIFARDLKKNGADIDDIRIAMGHKDIKTTLGYLYDDPSDIQRIINEYGSESKKYKTKDEKVNSCINDVAKYGSLVEQYMDGEFLTMKVRIV